MKTAIVRYTLLRKNNEIESYEDPHGGTRIGKWLARSPKKETDNLGNEWVILRGGKYHITGQWNTFRYRLRRSLYLAEHIGFQRIWVEGHSEPFDFDEKLRATLSKITSEAVHQLDSARETARTFFRPRKVDWTLIIMAAVAALGVGLALGGRFF